MNFIRLLLGFTLLCCISNPLIAQSDLTDDGNSKNVSYTGSVQDFTELQCLLWMCQQEGWIPQQWLCGDDKEKDEELDREETMHKACQTDVEHVLGFVVAPVTL